jgi:hypothetical protein
LIFTWNLYLKTDIFIKIDFEDKGTKISLTEK